MTGSRPPPASAHRMNTAEPSCDLTGLWPEIYARWRASEIGLRTERLERTLVLELLRDVAGKDVLDVGCGDGDLVVDLWERGSRVAGVDPSEAMIAAASERARARGAAVDLSVARGKSLPFPSGRFAAVVAVTVLRPEPGAHVPRDGARAPPRRPARHWRAGQMEILGCGTPRPRLARIAALAKELVPHGARASSLGRAGRPHGWSGPGRDLLSALERHCASAGAL